MSTHPGLDRLTERAEHVVRIEDLDERLRGGEPLRVKLGLDPTARDVTLGWAVPLRKLRDFQEQGHTAVLIVGDFTARIGDPSGKSDTRRQLTKEEVQGYAGAVLDQFADVLLPEPLEVRYNSEWLEGMDLGGLLALTATSTVAQMLERDDFSKRHAEQRPISLIEFMYPLLQAYDSVAVRADVELGGTDQLFNLLLGRDVQRAYGQDPQIALTVPLLEGLDGVQKMSQSLGNYIGIRDEPADMFGKVMSIPDALVGRYASLAAQLPAAEVESLSRGVAGGGPEAGRAKRAVARAVVALYHGAEGAAAAEEAFDRQFKERAVPDDIPSATRARLEELEAVSDGKLNLPAALAGLGLTSSRGEARRLIAQGGVRLAGERWEEEEVPLDGIAFPAVLQVGKRRFVELL